MYFLWKKLRVTCASLDNVGCASETMMVAIWKWGICTWNNGVYCLVSFSATTVKYYNAMSAYWPRICWKHAISNYSIKSISHCSQYLPVCTLIGWKSLNQISNILYSNSWHSNYLAASTPKSSCCTAAAGRLVPLVLFSSLHNSGEEVHQLVLSVEVCIESQVLITPAHCQVLLVLFDFQVAGFAHPPRGFVFVGAWIVGRHVQHVASHFPCFPGWVECHLEMLQKTWLIA